MNIPCENCLTVGICSHKVKINCYKLYDWIMEHGGEYGISVNQDKQRILKERCFKDSDISHFICSSMSPDLVWIMRRVVVYEWEIHNDKKQRM